MAREVHWGGRVQPSPRPRRWSWNLGDIFGISIRVHVTFLAFLLSAEKVSRRHLLVPYREDWAPIGDEGFAAYAQRVSAPYARAVQGHFDAERETWTERGIEKLSVLLRRGA